MSRIDQWNPHSVFEDECDATKSEWIEKRVRAALLEISQSGKAWLGKKHLSGPMKGQKIYKLSSEMAYEHDTDLCDEIQSDAIKFTMLGCHKEAAEETEKLEPLVEAFLRDYYDSEYQDHIEAEHSAREH